MTSRTYDLQVHTAASSCSGATPAEVVEAAIAADLDGIAVTNHDTLAGVAAVQEAAPPDLEVIPGVEVTTRQGNILALGVSSVPTANRPIAVIDEIQDQGGVAVLSHPFDSLREWFFDDLKRISRAVDAVEATNSRCLRERYNQEAREFARRHGLAVTGGSDAHFPMEVGRALTVCDGGALESIREGTTETRGRGRYVSGHLATKLYELFSRYGRA